MMNMRKEVVNSIKYFGYDIYEYLMENDTKEFWIFKRGNIVKYPLGNIEQAIEHIRDLVAHGDTTLLFKPSANGYIKTYDIMRRDGKSETLIGVIDYQKSEFTNEVPIVKVRFQKNPEEKFLGGIPPVNDISLREMIEINLFLNDLKWGVDDAV